MASSAHTPTEVLRNTESIRISAGLHVLQNADPEIIRVIKRATFVSAYALDGSNGWARAEIEGPLYIVKRGRVPVYRLIILNQLNPQNLVEDISALWELSSQDRFIFFRISNTAETQPNAEARAHRVAGLWFSDDAERKSVEEAIEAIMRDGQATTLSGADLSPPGLTSSMENLSRQDSREAFQQQPTLSQESTEESTPPLVAAHAGPPQLAANDGREAGAAILSLLGVLRNSEEKPPISIANTPVPVVPPTGWPTKPVKRKTDEYIPGMPMTATKAGAARHSVHQELQQLPARYPETGLRRVSAGLESRADSQTSKTLKGGLSLRSKSGKAERAPDRLFARQLERMNQRREIAGGGGFVPGAKLSGGWSGRPAERARADPQSHRIEDGGQTCAVRGGRIRGRGAFRSADIAGYNYNSAEQAPYSPPATTHPMPDFSAGFVYDAFLQCLQDPHIREVFEEKLSDIMCRNSL